METLAASFHIASSYFRGGRQAQENDIFIDVMGLTGSGKSKFISHLTEAMVRIGDTLISCTQEVNAYQYQYDDSTNVYLEDTPGFDDKNLSDADVLKEIATWLTLSYNNEVKLAGILYLHRITDLKMGGSAMKNLFMFKKLCGHDALERVVLVTNMWELVDEQTGLKREEELKSTEDFWQNMLCKGSEIRRHCNTQVSAQDIVKSLIAKSLPRKPVLLAIQDEMVNKKKALQETEAGMELQGMLAQERQRFDRKLQQAQQEIREAMMLKDKESQLELARQKAAAEAKIKQLERQQKEIKIDMERLHQEKLEKLEDDINKHKRDMEVKVREKDRVIAKLTARVKKQITPVHTDQSAVASASNQAWGRTISLSLSGANWAFAGPNHSRW